MARPTASNVHDKTRCALLRVPVLWYVCAMAAARRHHYSFPRQLERPPSARLSSKIGPWIMSERLSIPRTELSAHSPASTSATSLHPERRQSRRAGVSLQVRLCTADFRDGTFEEVRTTENASRKAIYFFTTADRYYKGMRLRVTSPYDPKAGAANLEQHGEVVRVHRREGGYGVAVALGSMRGASSTQVVPSGAYASSPSLQSSAPLAAFQMPSRERSASEIERRVAMRSPFIAPVELIDIRTGLLI